MKEHIRQKRQGSHRFFFTAKEMAEAKRDEAHANRRAKQEGMKPGVRQYHCSCGAEGCWITMPCKCVDVTLARSKKVSRKRETSKSVHFSGKVISK